MSDSNAAAPARAGDDAPTADAQTPRRIADENNADPAGVAPTAATQSPRHIAGANNEQLAADVGSPLPNNRSLCVC